MDTSADIQAPATAVNESHFWQEFKHPQFRRGRMDLLVGIKRQEDVARFKRRKADLRKENNLSILKTDVYMVSGDLRAVNGKLDNIFSLPTSFASGNQPAPIDLLPEYENTGKMGNQGSVFTAERAPSSTTINSAFGTGQKASGSSNQQGHYPHVRGPSLGYQTTPRHLMGQQHEQGGWSIHQNLSQRHLQTSPATRLRSMPNQVDHQVTQPPPSPLPSLAAAAAAHEEVIAGNGTLCQQLPPLLLQQPKLSHLQYARAEKQRVTHPRNRGGSGGGDVGGGDSFTCPAPVLTDTRRQEPYCFPYRPLRADDVSYRRGGHWDGGDSSAEMCRWEKALWDGTIPGLHMLSESATRLSSDTDTAKQDSTTPNDRQPPSCQI